ncbi:Gfo/Idh/MocA family oxidoreductase [Galbibacter mesophilus]|uniref:hypothetical protein n=1 Tax=Galbibacter mesophilus TaxID=379069 RepID=UPI001F5C4CE7|nr:hypothetical protein [Galbibacter mesophilus]MCM5664046.1 hypothetical protein [Galbibacter mesophilus]
MINKTKSDPIIDTIKESTHHEFIIKDSNHGSDVLTEKLLTTDENKYQKIIDAERRSKKNLITGFNYRWSPYIKELLVNNTVGIIT